MVSVPSRMFGFVTIPVVGYLSGAYEVIDFGALSKAVALYSVLGFSWALLVEFNWCRVREFFKRFL